MQLTYRGARYTANHQSVEILDTALQGRFLGARYHMKTARAARSQKTNHLLSYRLAKYSTQGSRIRKGVHNN